MERLLIALDDRPGSLKAVEYAARLLKGCVHVEFVLFHVLPPASPNLLTRDVIRRIEAIQESLPHVAGYFWHPEEEDKMRRTFATARDILLQAGFSKSLIHEDFGVEGQEIAYIIVERAKALNCSTVVMGRRGLSRVKEFFLGSVSKSVTSLARGMTVWIVDA
ncbi:universal stress protein [Desulfosoma caldarium]|uniref:Nucleotide-binding universal stress UspA family protein n=1 Tax=Desulfosoma caldarium TaxID=610254 RepID=A0A3N1VFA2_9BACT|nr:universal stress protein [Desulfosoma caldarium]ROR01514.1 nucleotide-binding universal stress UspA family protein [Desulfosoma caldarium]